MMLSCQRSKSVDASGTQVLPVDNLKRSTTAAATLCSGRRSAAAASSHMQSTLGTPVRLRAETDPCLPLHRSDHAGATLVHIARQSLWAYSQIRSTVEAWNGRRPQMHGRNLSTEHESAEPVRRNFCFNRALNHDLNLCGQWDRPAAYMHIYIYIYIYIHVVAAGFWQATVGSYRVSDQQ